MEPMHLPEVEKHYPEGRTGEALRKMKEEGKWIPQILHLFAFKPEVTDHLQKFYEGVMRGPSPLSPGQRELIAAFTSRLNGCRF